MLLKDCQSIYYITYPVWTNLGWDEPFANIEASLGYKQIIWGENNPVDSISYLNH